MWNENPMKKYASEHPGCTLEDYCNYLDEIEQKRREEKKKEEKQKEEALKSFTNKCFKLNFNGDSILFFKITKDITTLRESLKVDAYQVYENRHDVSMSFEAGRIINPLWLPNQSVHSGIRYCNIIPEEVFNNIVKNFEDMKEKVRAMKEI